MARGRDDMREVELVEVVDAADAVASTADTATFGTTPAQRDRPTALAPSRWSPTVRARVRTAVLTVVAVVLAATGVSTVMSERREVARLRALADVPGVLAPLAGPPQELWRTESWPVAGLEHVAGRLVTVMVTASGLEAVALEPRTGEVVWRTTLPSDAPHDAPAECLVPGAPWAEVPPDRDAEVPPDRDAELLPDRDAEVAPALDPDLDPVLVCLVADEVGTTTEARGVDQYTYPVRTRLLVVDAVTGELLEDDPVVPPVSLSSVGTDLLVGSIDDRGHARLTRAHPRTGETRWTFTTPEPVPVDQFGQRRMTVHSEGDLVVADAGTVLALSPAGEVLLELPGVPDPFRNFTQAVAGGRFLARSSFGTDTRTTELVEVATGRATTVDGFVVTPYPDDGSLPDLMLLGRPDASGLVAQDSRTGETLWTVTGHHSGPPIILDGRVVAADDARIEALDGATGQVVWSASTPDLSPSVLVTDGRVVVAASSDGSDGDLVAFDVDDGRQAWSSPSAEQPHLFTEDGRLFGYGRAGLIAYGSGSRPD